MIVAKYARDVTEAQHSRRSSPRTMESNRGFIFVEKGGGNGLRVLAANCSVGYMKASLRRSIDYG